MKRELTTQELLDRYVHSIKTMLPPDKMEDIAAEIRSNLESLMDDRAAQQGREVSLPELSAILKQYGHPVVVASRYRDEPRRGLISAELFPFYWFTLRALLGLIFFIKVFGAAFNFPARPDLGLYLLQVCGDLMLSGFFLFGGVTLVFAVWEHFEFRFRYSEKWKPESLPPVPPRVLREPAKPSRPTVPIVGGIVWLVFLALALYSPLMSWVWGGRGIFVPSEALSSMRLPLLLLGVGWCGYSWLNHTRYALAEWRPLLQIALNLAGLAWAVYLLTAGDLLVPGPNWVPSEAQSVESMNRIIRGFLAVSSISSLFRCAAGLRHWMRGFGKPHQTADSAS